MSVIINVWLIAKCGVVADISETHFDDEERKASRTEVRIHDGDASGSDTP